MIGYPKYYLGQKVKFKIDNVTKTGTIDIIDSHGTFEQQYEVSYDILVEDENTLYKHIVETAVWI